MLRGGSIERQGQRSACPRTHLAIVHTHHVYSASPTPHNQWLARCRGTVFSAPTLPPPPARTYFISAVCWLFYTTLMSYNESFIYDQVVLLLVKNGFLTVFTCYVKCRPVDITLRLVTYFPSATKRHNDIRFVCF